MKATLLRFVCGLAGGVMLAATVRAQDAPRLEFPAGSPGCTIKQRVGTTDIEVVYSRPSMKDRKIFGGLVHFGEVWRTGANAATKITFSTPVKLNNTDVAAGSYALYTIPGESEWTIILNKGVGKSGTQYDEKDDVVRFKAAPEALGFTLETFTIEFNNIRDDSADIELVWEQTAVPIHVQLDVIEKLRSQIRTIMASDSKQKPYFQAATFYYEHGDDLQKASEWVDAAIAQNEAFYMVHLKAKIHAKMGDKEGALTAAKRSRELAETAKNADYVRLNDQIIASLK